MRTSASGHGLFIVSCAAALGSGAASQTPLKTELVADGFDRPMQVVQAPGDDERLFVVEQGGTVRVILDGVVLSEPLLDVTGLVSQASSSQDERGLLGMTFHPDYASNGFLYLNTTHEPGSGEHPSVVLRYTVTEDPNVADPLSALEILRVEQAFGNHNSSDLAFGPDGYLYIPFGDGGGPEDPGCRAQDGNEYLGKLLRLDVDGGVPYAIPDTNPYRSDPTHLDEIWAKGLRNPFRFSFDRETGDLYLGDVGQHLREEVNFQPPGIGGLNYGWKVMEGTTCFDPDPLDADCPAATASCFDAEFTEAIHEVETGFDCAIIGGFVYRGCSIPDLQGTYFYGLHCSDRILSFRWDGNQLAELVERTDELAPEGGLSIDDIVAFGQDNDGELYIVDRGGEIFAIVPDAPAPALDLGSGTAAASGVTPVFDACGLLEAGEGADLRVAHAPEGSPGLLIASLTEVPAPVFAGVLVPGYPFLVVENHVTDEHGDALIAEDVDGGLFGGPMELVMQVLVADPAVVDGVAFSNALRVIWR